MSANDAHGDEPVAMVAADPRWPDWFEAERRRISAGLPGDVRIEHFGSTAVPRLDAKPVVDMLVGLPAGGDRAAAPAARHRYAREKWAAVRAGHRTLLAYGAAKSAVVEELLDEARAWGDDQRDG